MQRGLKYSILILLSIVACYGCTMNIGRFEPNSHFAFPNSNVIPLGHVSAEISRVGFLSAKSVDKEMVDEVMNKALKEKGGDLLINYKFSTSTTWFILPIFTTALHVDGTACKMTVGRQELK